jgi:hypothetical protein
LLGSQWTIGCMQSDNRFAWSQSCEGFVNMARKRYGRICWYFDHWQIKQRIEIAWAWIKQCCNTIDERTVYMGTFYLELAPSSDSPKWPSGTCMSCMPCMPWHVPQCWEWHGIPMLDLWRGSRKELLSADRESMPD